MLHGTGAEIALQPVEGPTQEQVKSVRRKEWQRTCSALTTTPLSPSLCTPLRGGRGVWHEGVNLGLGKGEERCCFTVCLFVSNYLN